MCSWARLHPYTEVSSQAPAHPGTGATGRIFARRGYRRARLEEIAAEAGLTTGPAHSNFTNKEALFRALADHQVGKRRAEVGSILFHFWA
jgi:AcrR family transcriptional regulator